jgi:large subunit ribosomal protein L16
MGEMKGVSYRDNHICFGRFALQEIEISWITYGKIECEQRMITHYAHPGRKIWVHIFPNKPITMRPTKECMGSRKGSLKYWVFTTRTGRILFEMGGVYETVAREAARIDAYKMPICTQFVTT